MSQSEYSFTLILHPTPEMSEELADALYEAGCNDGSIAESGGIGRIYFHRQAASLGEAIATAIRDVESTGCKVDRLELQPDELEQVAGFVDAA